MHPLNSRCAAARSTFRASVAVATFVLQTPLVAVTISPLPGHAPPSLGELLFGLPAELATGLRLVLGDPSGPARDDAIVAAGIPRIVIVTSSPTSV
jgi:hypothetical protein